MRREGLLVVPLLIAALLVGCGGASQAPIKAVDAYAAALARGDYDAAWGIAKIYCHEQKLADKCLAYTAKLLEAYPDRADYKAAREAGLAAQQAEAGPESDGQR